MTAAADDVPAPLDQRAARPALSRLPVDPVILGVAVLAFVVRLSPVLAGGGLGSYGRYDDGVYYAGADALTFGRMPYRDFVLLHPPGILLVLAPFAVLGRLTTDPTGMAAGRLAFMALGGLNTALVAVIARRWSRSAALAAGLLYACWMPAVYGEQSTLLEPVGTLALLVALVMLLNTAKPPTWRAEVIAGVALGFACAIKIWYVAPWAAVVVWLLVARQWHGAARVVAAGAAALAVVLLPFFVVAPARMFDLIVRDQLLRPQASASRVGRLASIMGVETALHGHTLAEALATGMVLLAIIGSAVVCWRRREARMVVVVLAFNLTVLLASPSYFPHYAQLTAAPAAVVAGIGGGALWARRREHAALGVGFVAALGVVLALGAAIVARPEGSHFPGSTLAAAAPAGCVQSDDPQALIQMNRLSSDLREGCPLAVDVTGITYDRLHDSLPDGRVLSRPHNVLWQHFLLQYLDSARSFVVIRRHGDGLSDETSRRIESHRVIARADGIALLAGRGR